MAASCLLLVTTILVCADAFYLPIFEYYPIFQDPYQPYPYHHKKYQANYLSAPISNYQQGYAYQARGNDYQQGNDGDDYQQSYQGKIYQQNYPGKNDRQGYANSYQLGGGDNYRSNYLNNNQGSYVTNNNQGSYATNNKQGSYVTNNNQGSYASTNNYLPNYSGTNKALDGKAYQGDQDDTYPN